MIEDCFYEILVKEDLECKYNLRDALEILSSKMGKIGSSEAERIIGRMHEITAFDEELDKFFSECDWYLDIKKQISED